jgi:hypothetical protein
VNKWTIGHHKSSEKLSAHNAVQSAAEVLQLRFCSLEEFFGLMYRGYPWIGGG